MGKKNFLIAKFGNEDRLNFAVAQLKKNSELKIEVRDRWTLLVFFLKKDENLERKVREIVERSYGYVEKF